MQVFSYFHDKHGEKYGSSYLFLIGILILFCLSCNPKKPTRPNVILIFPDQYGQYSLGFWSQGDHAKYIQGNPDPISTPALDKLANEGIVFSRAVSNYPLCSPYRGMLLSGMYPDHNGLTTNCRADRDMQLRSDATCITDVFSSAGYHVSYFGKCHWQRTEPVFDKEGTYVGTTEEPGGNYINRYDTYIPPGPDRHSIDYFFQVLKDDHFNPMVYSNDPKAITGKPDGELYRPGRFSSELESATIMDYLSNTHNQRDPDKPFFMIWSLNPPHNPWTEESTYMDFFHQYTDDGAIKLGKLLTHENADSTVGNYAPYYFANVSAVDHFIGKVLTHLDKLNLSENTIMVFSSDHGEMLGSHGRIGKNVPQIESFSIPFVIRWYEKLTHRVENLILSVPDIMPTLLGLAGLHEMIPHKVQATDYSRLLLHPNDTNKDEPASALFIHSKARGVYTGKYMFIVNEKDGKMESAFCYDNKKDPYQLNKIPFNDMEINTKESLKNELNTQLKNTNDAWYQKGICVDFLK